MADPFGSFILGEGFSVELSVYETSAPILQLRLKLGAPGRLQTVVFHLIKLLQHA